jgi:cobalt-zinc-cadmium resistance protein CzcA
MLFWKLTHDSACQASNDLSHTPVPAGWGRTGTKTAGMVLLLTAIMMVSLPRAGAQNRDTISSVTMEDVVTIATQNNLEVRNTRLSVKQSQAAPGSFIDLHPTNIRYFRGQIHSPMTHGLLTISQTLESPVKSYYQAQKNEHRVKQQKARVALTRKKVARQTRLAYNHWKFLIHKKNILREKLDHYQELKRIAGLRYKKGAITLLKKTQAETQFHQVQNAMRAAYKNIARAGNRLRGIMNTSHMLTPASDSLRVYRIKHPIGERGRDMIDPLLLKTSKEKIHMRELQLKAERASLFPDITAGYFIQSMAADERLSGWSVGISVPLWFRPVQNNIRQAKIEKQKAENLRRKKASEHQNHIQNLLRELNHQREQLRYYHHQGLKQARMLVNNSEKRYENEDIGYPEYLEGLETAYGIKTGYLETLKNYNQAAIKLEYFIKQSML